MSASKQANFDFSIDFALISKKKVEDKAGKKGKSYFNNKTRIKENKHIYHKNLYDPVLRKLKSEKFRQKYREKKKNKLLKTKNVKSKTLEKQKNNGPGDIKNSSQTCETKSEHTENYCNTGNFNIQAQLKTVKNIFPPGLLKEFPFLASSDSEDEILSLFKLFDSAITNSNFT